MSEAARKKPLFLKGNMARVLASIREEDDLTPTYPKKPASGKEKVAKALSPGDQRQTTFKMPSPRKPKVVKLLGSIRKKEDPNQTSSKMSTPEREKEEKVKVVTVLRSTARPDNLDQGKTSSKVPSAGKEQTVKVMRSAKKADPRPKLTSPKIPSAGKEKVAKVLPPNQKPKKKEALTLKDQTPDNIPKNPSKELMLEWILDLHERILKVNRLRQQRKPGEVLMLPGDREWLEKWEKTTDKFVLWSLISGLVIFFGALVNIFFPQEWIPIIEQYWDIFGRIFGRIYNVLLEIF
ncbi:uncharacterized protein Dana_GF28161 [Drosophila ananassae]|uniref:Uncharacterized protein n=1 Tax=Drosophila ananassae TaxID=7217 RepID=A0A0P8XGJ7_DROAN|nr:proteoglycan 4 [Drosophila ananassae]KPU73833.1 uncharacterized protein Dana_GF28161 [Drosophila ananassae]